MTHQTLISLASNYDQEENLHQAHLCLAQILSSCHYTEAIWTEPFAASTKSPLYLNQLVEATTTLNAAELEAALKDIEQRMGRTAEERQKGVVRIDLDLLQFDNHRYHLRDWDRPYIQALLPR
ncbi:MAG: 2-amino-4-hydroxy-6-hydroxymethyldihydropteridine diphosphokinase [Prevotella sp.]|nr:2-amino-4-hydroxy-6-hydroxymethyldihydropteridine diphosphokinase [Prevotella sp.]